MIDIDKLDELPFREAIHTRFKPDSDFNSCIHSCIRKKYRTERISYKEWKIARDTIKHNIGKSIDHAYSNFCYRSTGYCKDYFWRRFEIKSYGAEYRVVDGLVVYDNYSWRKYKERPVKSEYRNPKLVQARAEKRQREKRNLRLRKLAQKNKQYDFRTQEQIHIDKVITYYNKIPVEKLENFTLSIVRINKPDIFGIVRDHIEVVCFPDKMLKQGYFMQFTNGLLSGMQKCVLIKTLQ